VDEGLPIAYEMLDAGVPVYASDGERVGTALGDHRTTPAHLLGPHFPLGAGSAAFPIRVEEHRRIDTSAKALHLPIPYVGIGSG